MDYSKSNWIWVDDWNKCNNGEPVIVYFKKEFTNADIVRISANSRYKLYINGMFVQEGPQKGTNEVAYLDTADISAFVKKGRNEAFVKVLYYPENPSKRNDSLYYSQYPCLYIEDHGEEGELAGRNGWISTIDSGIRIVGEDFEPSPIHESEIVNRNIELIWNEAKPYDFFQSKNPIAPFNFEDRNIPSMEHHKHSFNGVVCVRQAGIQTVQIKKKWEYLINNQGKIEIPANTTEIVEISAGEEMCGYPNIKFANGKGTTVEFIYAEAYGISQPDVLMPNGLKHLPPQKTDRTDYVNGSLEGTRDIYQLCGDGTDENPECYEPYLFRTFRYIKIKVSTGENPVFILSYDYTSTGYPLVVKRHPVSQNEEYNQIWDMSLRTLKRCMHETYVDCPFYEQLQYTMDSRVEMLFTYEISDDDRLARQAIESFRKTQRSDGMIQASAPAVSVNVIPGFNIFYIMMVYDHMVRFKDVELVKHHINCIDGIINYFDKHLSDKGLVGSVGGVLFQHRYWSFIDWCKEWNDNIGVPTAKNKGDGSLTMESLLYLYGLNKAVSIADYIGRKDLADEYLRKAHLLSENIMRYCKGENGLIQDGPGIEEYSTHCQVWAVLNDLVSNEQGISMIEKTYGKENIPQCSVSMSFYLIEAMNKLGILEKNDNVWDPWRKMLRNNMTTCVENDTDERSDCHAWGAIMLYALPNYYLKNEKGRSLYE